MIFSILDALSFGWNKLLERFGFWILVMVAYLLITHTSEYVVYSATDTPFIVLASIFDWLISTIFTLGLLKMTLEAYEDEHYGADEFLKIFKYLLHYIVATFIYIVIVVIGLMLLVVPGVVFGIKLFFYNYFIIDKNMGLIECLEASFKLTKGNFLKLLLFFLLIIAMNIVGVLFAGIGVIFTFPITFFAMVYVYKEMLEHYEDFEALEFSESPEEV